MADGAGSGTLGATSGGLHDLASGPMSTPGFRMSPERRFTAVSLDLWFTTLTYEAASDERWQEARIRTLSNLIRTARGVPVPDEELRRAVGRVRARPLRATRRMDGFEPGEFVRQVAGEAGGTVVVPPSEAGLALSAAGLSEHPPEVNPEVGPFIEALTERGVPVISITNTGRLEQTWRSFLSSRGVPPFRTIVTSCEVGLWKPDPEIFREAARRLSLRPEEIVHVGDRWDLDVEGALSAGCGAVLYRGLWPMYPPDEASDTPVPSSLPRGVRVADRLSEILDSASWEISPVA
jgi:HAD superfamily hydrolase (TIGR01509 family)